MKKNIFLFGIIFVFLGVLAATPVQAQEFKIQGSEAVWETFKGVMGDPWAVFKPLEGFRPAGIDLYVWVGNARNFIGEFQNALSLSPQEAVNLVLGKTSGIIWLDILVNYIKELIQKVSSSM
jgi:hypothetical protein